MSIRSLLKKILPPPVNSFNREIQGIKEYDASLSKELKNNIQQLNTESFNQLAEMQVTVKSITEELHDIKNMISGTPVSNERDGECYSTNVVKQMWENAGMESAIFATEKMASSESLSNAAMLREYALQRAGEGLYLEFGVFSGTSINQIAELKPRQTIYGFDSFEGLPETWRNGYTVGIFKKDMLPEVKENVVLVKGWFNESLPEFLEVHPGNCAFIHIDCDIYTSTKTVFNILAPRIVQGTIIVFDEYFNYPSWKEHEHKAFIEFLNEHELDCEYFAYVGSHQQVAAFIK